MDKPLVTVICLCYNHENYVRAALQSVLDQRYDPIELIVVDDFSTDGSRQVIEQFIASHPGIKYFPQAKNLGNCKAFNTGFRHAKGDYIIDLAADDILKVDRVSEGVKAFEALPTDYGINFCNAEIIVGKGKSQGTFYNKVAGELRPKISEGQVFEDLLQRYFICPPTLMMRREVFEYVGGYDETLAYEDFDFLLKASRKYKFCYTDKVLVKRRVLPTSMSAHQYRRGSQQLESTYYILERIKPTLTLKSEKRAYVKRLLYEGRKALELMDLKLAGRYFLLLLK